METAISRRDSISYSMKIELNNYRFSSDGEAGQVPSSGCLSCCTPSLRNPLKDRETLHIMYPNVL